MNKFLLIIFMPIALLADVVTKVDTARKVDAHIRDFIKKVGDVKNSAGVIKGQFKCMSKGKDVAVCAKRNCETSKECLLGVFTEFEAILKPIMDNLVGIIENGKLKPGVITALPLMWDDPKSEKVQQFESMAVYNLAAPLNDIYDLIKLIKNSLDDKVSDEDLPIAVAEKTEDLNLQDAPLPSDADENAVARPIEEEVPQEAEQPVEQEAPQE